jgi:hypothetical protein
MAKVKINKLPDGYSVSNGKVVKSMQEGGFKTGAQHNFSLTTFPNPGADDINGDSTYFPSGGTVNKTLKPVPRDEANLEAEKGETALTDMNNDGDFELYDIGGKRHHSGGTPLNLPDQSFIFSDTSKMKLNKGELREMGIESKKKITPAKVSKNYDLNKFIEVLDDPHSDKISLDTAEYMLDKNKKKLSQLAFVQEAKKGFEEGVPLAAHPYLKSSGINPGEYAMKIKQVNEEQKRAIKEMETPPTDNEKAMVLQQFIQSSTPPPKVIPDVGGISAQESNEVLEIPTAQFGGSSLKEQSNQWMSQLMQGQKSKPSTNRFNFVNPFKQDGYQKAIMPDATNNILTDTFNAIGPPKELQKGGNTKKRVNLQENWNSPEWADFKEKFYNNYATSTGKTLTDADKEALDALFIKDMEQKKLMHSNLDSDFLKGDDWDTSWTEDADGNRIQDKNWKYKSAIEKLKTDHDYDGEAFSEDEVINLENFYKTLSGMSGDDQYKDMLEGTNFYDRGTGTNRMGEDYQTTGYYGDDFLGFGVDTEYEPGDDNYVDQTNTDEPRNPKFWLQDQLGIANAVSNKFSLKKRYPVGVKYQENLIEPLYQDPGRAIAAIGEQAAIAADTASTFAGPQRAAAVQAKAQGVAAEQIADTLGRVDNQNQKIASETNMRNAEIKWKTQDANKKELKELYNNTILVDENYDNQLRAANEMITKQMQNAYTNRAKTDSLNAMYPQFDIDPSTGGLINITDPKAFYAHLNKDQSQFDKKLEKMEILDKKEWLEHLDDKTIQYLLKTEDQNPSSDLESQILSGGYGNNVGNPYGTFDQQNIQQFGSEHRPFALKRRKRRLKSQPNPL